MPKKRTPTNRRSADAPSVRRLNTTVAATTPRRRPSACPWMAMPAHHGADGPDWETDAVTIGSLMAR